jgi:hypothetical protein
MLIQAIGGGEPVRCRSGQDRSRNDYLGGSLGAVAASRGVRDRASSHAGFAEGRGAPAPAADQLAAWASAAPDPAVGLAPRRAKVVFGGPGARGEDEWRK